MSSESEQLSELVAADLKAHEGFRDRLYDDKTSRPPKKTWQGKLTILWGYNIEDRGLPEWVGELLLKADIENLIHRLSLQWHWWPNLSLNRKRALVNMGYNLGIGGLLGFRNTIRLIALGKFIEAGESAMKSKWAREDVSSTRSQFVKALLQNG